MLQNSDGDSVCAGIDATSLPRQPLIATIALSPRVLSMFTRIRKSLFGDCLRLSMAYLGMMPACLAVMACCAGESAERDREASRYLRFVDPQGDDAAAGSAAAPWRTFQHAADRAIPGDKLFAAPGHYRGFH